MQDLLGAFDGVPRLDDFLHRRRKGLLQRAVGTEHMRVAPDHFGRQAAGDVVEVEGAALLGEPGVQDHLEQDVAELGLQLGVAAGRLDGLRHLKGLLEEVFHEGLMGEGPHPGAVDAQLGHCPHQRAHRIGVLVSQGRRRPR